MQRNLDFNLASRALQDNPTSFRVGAQPKMNWRQSNVEFAVLNYDLMSPADQVKT